MGISLAIASLALGPTVSFAADAVTVGDFVMAISRESGVRLDVATIVAAEPLIIQFEAQPLEDVKERLADVIGGTWVDQGGVPTLSRAASLRTDQERAERREIAELVGKIIESRLRQFDAAGPLDAKTAELLVARYRLADLKPESLMEEYRRMASDNPIVRATMRIARTQDLTVLARMRRGQRIVLSDVPTAMQLPMSVRAKEALATLRGELALMEAARNRIGRQQRKSVNFTGLPSVGPGSLKDGYGKAVLAVQRYGAADFRFDLAIVAKDGSALVRGNASIPELSAEREAAIPQTGPDLEISADAKAFATLCMRGSGVNSGGSYRVVLDDGKEVWPSFWVPFEEANNDDPARLIVAKLTDPVRYDAVGLIAGSLLRQLAKEQKKQLIASVSDDAVVELCRAIASGKVGHAEGLLALLRRTTVPETDRIPLCRVSSEGNWLEVRPNFRVYAREDRFDRRALRDLLATARKEGSLPLSAAAQYGRIPWRNSLDVVYLKNGEGGLSAEEVFGVFSRPLPLLSTLLPAQWDSLTREPQPLSALTPDQREIVRRWVYEDLIGEYFYAAQARAKNAMAVGQRPLELEPTERFPRGLPRSLRVSIEQTRTPVVITQSSQGLRFVMDSPSLGMFEGMQTNPAKYPDASKRSLAFYRPGNRVGYRVTLYFDEEDKISLNAVETQVVPGSKYGPRSALPEATLKDAERVREAFLKSG